MTSTEEAVRGGLPTELRQWARLIGTEPRGARELFNRAADEIERLRSPIGHAEDEREAITQAIWKVYKTHDIDIIVDAVLASPAWCNRHQEPSQRPYDEATDHEYGAWETDDLEEHALDMLAVVAHRRALEASESTRTGGDT